MSNHHIDKLTAHAHTLAIQHACDLEVRLNFDKYAVLTGHHDWQSQVLTGRCLTPT